jgi:hypothetical protein
MHTRQIAGAPFTQVFRGRSALRALEMQALAQ